MRGPNKANQRRLDSDETQQCISCGEFNRMAAYYRLGSFRKSCAACREEYAELKARELKRCGDCRIVKPYDDYNYVRQIPKAYCRQCEVAHNAKYNSRGSRQETEMNEAEAIAEERKHTDYFTGRTWTRYIGILSWQPELYIKDYKHPTQDTPEAFAESLKPFLPPDAIAKLVDLHDSTKYKSFPHKLERAILTEALNRPSGQPAKPKPSAGSQFNIKLTAAQ